MNLQSEFRTAILSRGNTLSTFDAYWTHVESFVRHCRQRHRKPITRHEVDIADVYAWRDYLAATLHLSPKSLNQAIAAVKFLFAHVIGKPLVEPEGRPLRVREASRQNVRRWHIAVVQSRDHMAETL